MIDKAILIDNEDLMELMLDRRYLVGAPKSEKDLRVQYPDLYDYPEFKRDKIRNSDDLVFVWWFRCATSPYYDEPDEKKLEKCIRRAYRSEARRAAKLDEFRNLKFPDDMKAAFRRMESLNTGARIENYVRLLLLRKNIHEMLDVDVRTLDPKSKDEWTARAPKLWQLLQDTQVALERGAFGVSQAEETLVGEDDGAVRDWRNQQTQR